MSSFSRRAVFAAALVSASYGSAAFAQVSPPSDDDSAKEVIVTGTRSTGMRAADSPAPLTIVGADALKRVGQTDLNQALAQQVPSIQAQAFGNDQTAFHPSIKLRGLNPNHTLVLLNGKRRHGTANVVVTNAIWTGGAAPDMGLIPEDAIGDVQVLLDGAAAQYGTDAIAGVVNIILKKNDNGGSLNLTAGQYIEGDGKTWDAMGNIGIKPIEDMYLNVTAERKYHGYSFRGDVDPRVVDTGATTSANLGVNGGRTLLARFPGITSFANYPYVNRIFGDGKMQLTNAMYNMGYTGINNVEIYSFGSYSRRIGSTYQNYRLPNVVFGKSAVVNPTATPVTGVVVNPLSPPLSGDVPYPTGFSPREVLRETDYAFTGGAKGTFGNTTVDLSATYGRDFDGIYVEDSANAALYYDSSTATQKGYSPTSTHNGDFVNSQITVNLDVTHDLDIGLAKPVTIAGGIEHRRENYQLRAGEVASYYISTDRAAPGGGIQSFFGYAPSNASSNDRKNWSEYLDLSTKPIDPWFIEGAVRHEHYSDFGNTTIFKLTSRFDITPAIAIRGTVSTGFRAPTLAEGFYSGINVSVSSLSGIFAPNSAGAKALGLGGLKPEKSTNFSAGLVFKPASRLNVTIDGYLIKLRDRIVQSGGFTGYSNNCKYLPSGYAPGMNLQALYDAFHATNPSTCTGIVSPSVLDALFNNNVPIQSVINTINGGATGSLAINSFVNGLNSRTTGIDFMANYMTPVGNLGKVDWTLAMNYNKTKITKLAPPPANVNQTQPVVDKYAQSNFTDTTPKFRATFGALWSWKMFEVNLRESYYSNTGFLTTFPTNANQDYYINVGDAFITDLEVTVKIGSGLRFSAGANNLFNKYPNKYPADFRAAQYAISSTAYITKYPTTSPYGVMGGYYYGRASLKF